ncbi:MAG: RloB family protein [Bacteroidota bacterium]
MKRGRRPPRGRKIKPVLYVFCEGETEEAYVNLLKSYFRIPSLIIHSKIAGNNIHSSKIKNYKQGRPTHEKDQDFLLYDLDVPHIAKHLKSLENVTLLVSNPCIEFWFLLHEKDQQSPVNTQFCCDEVFKRNKIYQKGKLNEKLKVKLIEKMPKAVKRAKALETYQNPSSTIYRLIDLLQSLNA